MLGAGTFPDLALLKLLLSQFPITDVVENPDPFADRAVFLVERDSVDGDPVILAIAKSQSVEILKDTSLFGKL